MELNTNLSQEFAKAVLTGISDVVKRSKRSDGSTVYGKVISKDTGKAMVMLDGSDGEHLMPCSLANDANVGDRVKVQIKNRKAVVTGNITSPANATVGDFYMELTDSGLNIGKKNGNYISVGDDEFRFCNSSGTVLATMSLSDTNYGNAMLMLASVLGLRSSYGTDRAEVITRATNGSNAAAAMQVRSGDTVLASLTVDKTGAYTNGYRVLAANNLVTTGSVTATGSIPANRSVVLSTKASIPSGFMMLGLSSINVSRNTGARSRYLRLSRYTTATDGTINITVTNDNTSAMDAQVVVTWFALRCSTVNNTGNTDINLIVDD